MQYILKVKDANGNWIEIPALVGQRGPQGVPGVQGQQGIQGIQGVPGIKGENGERGSIFWKLPADGWDDEDKSGYLLLSLSEITPIEGKELKKDDLIIDCYNQILLVTDVIPERDQIAVKYYTSLASIIDIEKTSTAGYVDTYTITLTNGEKYTFTVTNGKDGIDGAPGKDGDDYVLTDADIAEIAEVVVSKIPPSGLPEVNDQQDGYVLMVEGGVWVAKSHVVHADAPILTIEGTVVTASYNYNLFPNPVFKFYANGKQIGSTQFNISTLDLSTITLADGEYLITATLEVSNSAYRVSDHSNAVVYRKGETHNTEALTFTYEDGTTRTVEVYVK